MASRKNLLALGAAAALVLLTLIQAAAVFVAPQQNQHSAATIQAWPSATINVTVTDDAGRPISEALVTVLETGDIQPTDENGTALFTDLPADDNITLYEYNLTVAKAGYLGSNTRVNVSENWTTYVAMTLYGGSILGTVTTLSPIPGPIGNANVSIDSLGYGYWNFSSPEDGSYILSGLPAGTLTVTANATGYVPKDTSVSLKVGGGVLLNFILDSQTGSITGFVLNSITLQPIESANVSVKIDDQKTVTVTTGSDGSYNLTDIPEGTYSLTASKDGFLSSTNSSVQVVRGEMTAPVDFLLVEKPTRLFGVVRSGTQLLAGVNISVVGTGLYNISGPYGNYEILNLTAGNYTVVAAPEGYQVGVITGVVILPGGETELNINLTGLPGAVVKGTVIASDTREPLSGVLVTLVDLSQADGAQPRSTPTNIFGYFEFAGLQSGNYTIVFERTGYSPMESQKITVTENSVSDLTYQMSPLRQGFSGFIGDFDMAHSLMFIGVALTLLIFGIALFLRIRSFMAPGSSPAVYDQEEEEEAEGEEKKDKPGRPGFDGGEPGKPDNGTG